MSERRLLENAAILAAMAISLALGLVLVCAVLAW